MRKFLLILLYLLTTAAWAQDEITQISFFSDKFGNHASFWKVVAQGKTYVALKLKSPDKDGEATVVLDKALFLELEEKAAELKAAPNSLKADGFRVLWSKDSGHSKVRTLLGRWNGVKVKMIQVEENKNGKFEHQVMLDESYLDFTRALKKARSLLIP